MEFELYFLVALSGHPNFEGSSLPATPALPSPFSTASFCLAPRTLCWDECSSHSPGLSQLV